MSSSSRHIAGALSHAGEAENQSTLAMQIKKLLWEEYEVVPGAPIIHLNRPLENAGEYVYLANSLQVAHESGWYLFEGSDQDVKTLCQLLVAKAGELSLEEGSIGRNLVIFADSPSSPVIEDLGFIGMGDLELFSKPIEPKVSAKISRVCAFYPERIASPVSSNGEDKDTSFDSTAETDNDSGKENKTPPFAPTKTPTKTVQTPLTILSFLQEIGSQSAPPKTAGWNKNLKALPITQGAQQNKISFWNQLPNSVSMLKMVNEFVNQYCR